MTASTNAFRSGANPYNPGNDPFCIGTSGWYTLRHTFKDVGGSLVVDMDLMQGNTVVHHWSIASGDPIAGVGCNRYGWFANEEIWDLPIDNAQMSGCRVTGAAQCAAPKCASPNCFVNDTTGTDGAGCCTAPGGCKTIQGGIADASVGDAVSVAAGTYPEAAAGPLNVNKTLTLCGAQAGVDARTRAGLETHITDPQGTVVSADNVVIDGFTIEDNTAAFNGFGLDMAQGTTGSQVYNNIVQNNIVGIGLANIGVSQVLICQNLIQTNNNLGAASGAGIYTDEFVCGSGLPCTDFLVEQNAFKGNDDSGIVISNVSSPLTQLDVSTNTFDQNGRGIFLLNTDMSTIHNNRITNSTLAGSGAIRIFGGVDDLTITSNDLNTGTGWGIRMTNDSSLTPPSTGVVIHLNNIANFAGDGGPFGGGLFVGAGAHAGPVDAECNWWADPCGPFNVAANPLGMGQEVQEAGAPGDADFTPWLITAGPAPASGGGTCTGIMCVPPTTPTPTPPATPTMTPPPPVTSTPTLTATQTPAPGDTATPTPTPTATATSTATGTPTATSTPPPSPIPTASPFCGDGIVNQPSEECDDGNKLECDPVHPQRPAIDPVTGLPDKCNNSCKGLVCKDPSKIRLATAPRLDQWKAHGVLVPMEGSPIDFSAGDVSVILTKPPVRAVTGQLVFEASLPPGAVGARSNGGFKYKNHAAKQTGGIYTLSASPTNDGTFKVTVISYGDLSGAEEDMVTHFLVNGHEWTVHALWRHVNSGWVFDHVLP